MTVAPVNFDDKFQRTQFGAVMFTFIAKMTGKLSGGQKDYLRPTAKNSTHTGRRDSRALIDAHA